MPSHLIVRTVVGDCVYIRGRMGWLTGALTAGAMGAVVGGGAVVVSSMMSIGRMPPRGNVAGAAGFMATMFGVGSVVRKR